MGLTKHVLATRVADLAFLTLLLTIATLAYVSAILSMQIPYKATLLGLFELVLLVWVARCSKDRKHRRDDVAYALWLQAQTGVQIILTVYVNAAAALLGLFILNRAEPGQGWTNLVTEQNLIWLNSFGFTASITTVFMLSASRLHDLRRKDLNLHELKAGALNSAERIIPASEEKVKSRLEYYLDTLKQRRAPGLSRLWYGKKPTITKTAANGQTVYTATWTDCPSKICIAVEARNKSSTLLRMTCELRSGYFKLGLFVNPHDALALMTYMQANVIQLLGSELTLSEATARQDELRHLAVEMQLRILQAQIEPHFLFNTLANVRHLYRSSIETGEDMMDHLIMYLRCSMHELRTDKSTVAQELDLVLHYLAIMKIRMGDRLSYLLSNRTTSQAAFFLRQC